MCGIAGYILKENSKHSLEGINLLLRSISSRGPDDEGLCLVSRQKKECQLYSTDKTVPALASKMPQVNNSGAIISHDAAFIHSRYSIIDLSEGGHQPFISGDKSVAAIFNGEIYNYVELKKELSEMGVKFKTGSDTEVLVEGYALWKNDIWGKMNGFWAVVLYDFRTGSVVMSRDRIGVAPLYYRETDKGLYFSSYIKPLIDIDPAGITVDNDVMLGFMDIGIKDHDNSTFYSQIKSAPSASFIVFTPGRYSFKDAAIKRYWDFPSRRLKVSDISFEEAVNNYRETFLSAVKIRLRSDVKVSFELSGGLDSSSVVAAAALLSDKRITTYTVKTKGADEEPYARSILNKYNIDYRVLTDLEENFSKDCDAFSDTMEEPYDNPANYNHHNMLKIMKREGVHVVITGAGGDEVLAGYDSSFWPAAYREMKKEGFIRFLQADIHEFKRRFKTLKSSYKTLEHYFSDSAKIMFGHGKNHKDEIPGPVMTKASSYHNRYSSLSFHQRSLYHFNVALVPYYMRSTDHYTMGIPVEHRFPFMDYMVVETGMTMPAPYLFKDGWTKYILRKAMEPYLPKKILWRRKKMGFPFAYKRYLSINRLNYKPILESLAGYGIYSGGRINYDFLLEKNPVLLWRLISSAIWLKKNNKYYKA